METNTSGSWAWVATQVNDTDTGEARTAEPYHYINISEVWNQNPWNTDSHQTGYYRIVATLTDPWGNVLKNDSGGYMNAYSIFYLANEPPGWSQLNINESYPKQGELVTFSAYWEDYSGLSGWTFSWNATQTGSWENISSGSFSGTGNWSNLSLQIPDYADRQYGFRFYANDTDGLMNTTSTGYFTVSGNLVVELVEPVNGKLVAQNITFTVNTTIRCINGSCGNVQARVRYNQSGSEPDTDISTSEDQPFYIVSGSNPGSCSGNPLGSNEYCQITWNVNATGQIGSTWNIGALVESDQSNVQDNHTDNHTIQIVSCIVDITLQWDNVNFEPSDPGGVSNATGNQNDMYKITVEPITTCSVDIYGRADDLERAGGGYTIGAGNMSFSNTTNDYTERHSLGKSWMLFGQAIQPDTNLTTYYWIDIPLSMMEGEYNSTLYIEGVEEGEGA